MSLPLESPPMFLSTSQGVMVYHVAWTPPFDYAWKLNFAGFIADYESRAAGAGFILRDQNAMFVAGSAESLSNCENIVPAELTALSQGLDIAVNQGVEYLEVEGDCSIVFQLLNGRIEPISPRIQALVEKCTHYLQAFRDVKVRRVNIHSNEAANKMATLAVGEDEPVYWFAKPPPEITDVLVGDVIGRWVPASEA